MHADIHCEKPLRKLDAAGHLLFVSNVIFNRIFDKQADKEFNVVHWSTR